MLLQWHIKWLFVLSCTSGTLNRLDGYFIRLSQLRPFMRNFFGGTAASCVRTPERAGRAIVENNIWDNLKRDLIRDFNHDLNRSSLTMMIYIKLWQN